MATMKEAAMSSTVTISNDISPQQIEIVDGFFFDRMGAIKPEHNVEDSFSNLIGGLIKVNSIQRGKISCILTVKAPILNAYGGLHGGAIGAAAERVAIACARTVVGKEKDIFLGELSISCLYAAPHNAATSFLLKGKRRGCDAELVVDGSVVRSGRNLTVVTVDFRLKGSGRLAFMTRSTFFNMPVSRM